MRKCSPEIGWYMSPEQLMEQYRKALALDPAFAMARYGLGKVYVGKAMYAEAIAEFQAVLRLQASDPRILGNLGPAYAVSGNRAEAGRILAEMTERSKRGYVRPDAFATVYAGLGDKDRAFEWLNKGVADKAVFLYLGTVFDPLRSDPRFAELLRRMNLPR